MPFRTLCVTSRCKLEYSLNYLVCRGEEERRIHLSEVSALIIQSTGVALTASLLSELMDRKITVIFCDSKANPQAELLPFYGTATSSLRIREQARWDLSLADEAWKQITRAKIENQAGILKKYQCDQGASMLLSYAEQVLPGDTTNREGHAAKVYFNDLFGNGFTRSDESLTNAFLNYGYSILLSSMNREIVSFGYLTQLGIHHKNEFNDFNLGCDLMEPLRPIVDDYAKSGKLTEENFKRELNKLLNLSVVSEGKQMYLDNAIHLFVQSFFSFMREGEIRKLAFLERYEL